MAIQLIKIYPPVPWTIFSRLEKKGNHRGSSKNCKFSRTKFQPWRDQIINSGHGILPVISDFIQELVNTVSLRENHVKGKSNDKLNPHKKCNNSHQCFEYVGAAYIVKAKILPEIVYKMR